MKAFLTLLLFTIVLAHIGHASLQFKAEYIICSENQIGKEIWWVSEHFQVRETVIYPNHHTLFTQNTPTPKNIHPLLFFGEPVSKEREIFESHSIKIVNDLGNEYLAMDAAVSPSPIPELVSITQNKDLITEISNFIEQFKTISFENLYSSNNNMVIGGKKVRPINLLLGKGLYWGSLSLYRETHSIHGTRAVFLNSIETIDQIPDNKKIVSTNYTLLKNPLKKISASHENSMIHYSTTTHSETNHSEAIHSTADGSVSNNVASVAHSDNIHPSVSRQSNINMTPHTSEVGKISKNTSDSDSVNANTHYKNTNVSKSAPATMSAPDQTLNNRQHTQTDADALSDSTSPVIYQESPPEVPDEAPGPMGKPRDSIPPATAPNALS